MKIILINLDGLGDIPYKELGNKTPLEAADKPTLNYLAKFGKTGLMYVLKDIAPESDFALLSMLGYPLSKYPGRGIIEALGSNIKIKKGYVYIRGNFAEIKNHYLIDAQSKPPSREILKKINRIDKNIEVIPTVGHRCVVIIKKKVSPKVSNIHPGYKNIKNYSTAIPRNKKLKLKRCTGNKITADMLNNFIKNVENIMRDKTILLRGASNKIPKLKKLKNWIILAETPVEYGIGRLTGMKAVKKTDIIKQAIEAKQNVCLQLKGPDIYSHKGLLRMKKQEIEKIDSMLSPLKNIKNTLICITADHSSVCKIKTHSKDPVPVLIYGFGRDKVTTFSEKACKSGSLGLFQTKDLMKLLKC